ncbi:hypothetical protein [Thalassoglobus polymorphus]|uniref:Uncharacterized protein n=1 Tax=Thalassoglobus polymorphus TaxID=2527994 RepID=A0A517QUP4_9PLAN|nr:hypothetical protein [Thalassoglobus polymorphus]QDT35307.1 hypothetical protein Mal48_45830 [Thalassoglobus polymorphus]
MNGFDKQANPTGVPFRGTGKATDFRDVQDYQEDPNVSGYVTEFSKENPLTSVLSVFGFGLIVGAGVAATVISSREKQMSNHHAFGDFSNMLGDSMAKVVPEKMRGAFHRS